MVTSQEKSRKTWCNFDCFYQVHHMPAPKRIILGIDPGTNVLGFSVIECDEGSVRLLSMSTVHMETGFDTYEKLERIFRSLSDVICTYKPHEMAVEAPFFGKNIQSMLKLGRAQGVAIAAGMMAGLPVTEYSPKKVKSAITGNGNASKEQVALMLLQILKIETLPKYFDATDACAVAICHFYQRTPTTAGSSYRGWKEYVAKNAERVKK